MSTYMDIGMWLVRMRLALQESTKMTCNLLTLVNLGESVSGVVLITGLCVQAFPVPLTLISSTLISRDGMVNPNSLWYLLIAIELVTTELRKNKFAILYLVVTFEK